jgi:hypothetical protein
MTKQEIRKILRQKYPYADSIQQDQYGLWDVKFQDDFEETTLTFQVKGQTVRFIGEMVVEQ